MVNFQHDIESGFDVDLIKNYNTYHGEMTGLPHFQFMKILPV